MPPTVRIICQKPSFSNLYLSLQSHGEVSLPLGNIRIGYRCIPLYEFGLISTKLKGEILAHVGIKWI